MVIRQIIQEHIQQHGPISFDKFMEMALYYPELGYYSSDRNPIGTSGDYYTMPHLTPVFGAMIARQLKEMWEIMGQPKTFTVVEVGAGNGHLCRSIIKYVAGTPSFAEALHYHIVERSAAMCRRAKDILPPCVSFFESIDALPKFNGCVLSNELFDNMPFSIMTRKKGLLEVFVDYDLDFFEVIRPASTALKTFLSSLEVDLPEGERKEVSLQSIKFLKQVSAKLKKGFLLTIDYGYIKDALFHQSSTFNTLACYRRHKTYQDPYTHVGQQDITASVNFSALCHYGKLYGLGTAGYICQANFLRSLGLVGYLEENITGDAKQLAMARFIIDLLINQYGNKFKVLIQYKGIGFPSLTGLLLRERVKL